MREPLANSMQLAFPRRSPRIWSPWFSSFNESKALGEEAQIAQIILGEGFRRGC